MLFDPSVNAGVGADLEMVKPLVPAIVLMSEAQLEDGLQPDPGVGGEPPPVESTLA